MTWQDQAACRGAGRLFFSHDHEGKLQRRERLAKAQALCAACPVARQCREASRDEQHGVWSGVELDPPRHKADEQRPRNTGQFTAKPLEHGTVGGYKKCRQRPEGACLACKREHASDTSWRRAQGLDTGRIRRWSRRWMRSLRAAALAESWALRDHITGPTILATMDN